MRRIILSIALPLLLVTAAHAADIPTDQDSFTAYVAEKLKKGVPGAPVVIEGTLTIGMGELQLHLDRIFGYCKRNADSCEIEVERYIKGAAEVYHAESAPPNKEDVRLLIRSEQYIKALLSASKSDKGPPIQARQLVPGLYSVAALDNPRTIRMLVEKDNAKLGLSADEVFSLGAKNLEKILPPLMSVGKPAGNRQIGLISGNPYDSSRLLLHDSWAPLAQAQGGVLIVAVPTTDAVLYISESDTQAIIALRTLARNVMSKAPRQLSDVLLRWRENGWEVVAP